jgi:hypothetical protein
VPKLRTQVVTLCERDLRAGKEINLLRIMPRGQPQQ